MTASLIKGDGVCSDNLLNVMVFTHFFLYSLYISSFEIIITIITNLEKVQEKNYAYVIFLLSFNIKF